MTTPSRKSEIARRRARKHKLALLRRRYAHARSDAERDRILEKVVRFPNGPTVDQFLAAVPAAPEKRKGARA